jgi:hypothetical protein
MKHNTTKDSLAAPEPSTGLRFNEGKLRYDLVHPAAHEGMVKVLTKGSVKYTPRNWEKGLSWLSVVASLKRHLAAFEKGEDYDPETGLLHVDHLQCNAHFLSAYYKSAPQFDDRQHRYLTGLKVGLDIDGVIADFISHLLCSIGEDPARDVNHWNDPVIRVGFEKIKTNPEFWTTIPVLTYPADIPFEPCCYVTARSVDSCVTQKWLDENGFPAAPLISLGHNESKVETLKRLGVDVFIDDRFENFQELNANGILCYLFDAPHNSKYNVGHKRIKSLSQLV